MSKPDFSALERPFEAPADTPQALCGKPRSRSEEKRQQIIMAAADLFTELGFSNTSMDKVAERAGVSKQTVYSHFGSKEGIFVASIESKCLMNSLSTEFFCQQQPTAWILLELARHFNALLLSSDAVRIMRLCCASAETHPEVSELFYSAGPQNLHRLLSDYLQERATTAELEIANYPAAADQFLSMVNADEPFRARLGLPAQLNAEELDDYLKSCVRIFLKGYSAD